MERLFTPCADGLHEDCCAVIEYSARSGRSITDAAPLAILRRHTCSCACHAAPAVEAAEALVVDGIGGRA